jgi:hypothetical protein
LTPRKCIRISFVRCLFEEAYSMSFGKKREVGDPTGGNAEELHPSPQKASAWSGNQRANFIVLKQQSMRKETLLKMNRRKRRI